jgi:hypothetical protein
MKRERGVDELFFGKTLLGTPAENNRAIRILCLCSAETRILELRNIRAIRAANSGFRANPDGERD